MQITKIARSRETATHEGSTGICLQEAQFLLKEYGKTSEEHTQTKCWKRGKLATNTTSREGFPAKGGAMSMPLQGPSRAEFQDIYHVEMEDALWVRALKLLFQILQVQWQLPTAWNSSSRGSDTLSLYPDVLTSRGTYSCIQALAHRIK